MQEIIPSRNSENKINNKNNNYSNSNNNHPIINSHNNPSKLNLKEK
jgi:hypothetical protein